MISVPAQIFPSTSKRFNWKHEGNTINNPLEGSEVNLIHAQFNFWCLSYFGFLTAHDCKHISWFWLSSHKTASVENSARQSQEWRSSNPEKSGPLFNFTATLSKVNKLWEATTTKKFMKCFSKNSFLYINQYVKKELRMKNTQGQK